MDRVEAYRLLTQRMEQFDADAASSTLSEDLSLSEEVWGEAEGVLYTIDLRLERGANGSLTLLGSIHDYNTAKLSLLRARRSIE
ncbi:hypothetical protein CVM52_06065 [Pseudooceanicola lipolyticus]|uniref:Uncharacterized protein n=1 Tax=Pseudooceanicola lipolyticus TaxID=2029104 RepID=A0A2M8J467_9RHOB|nr:hypothetical protein [Pseudooceanicola lipolyticus]PJE37558.1 hypothetical protein CVM52_06065 [Pseudooceanicola lipolyticus]